MDQYLQENIQLTPWQAKDQYCFEKKHFMRNLEQVSKNIDFQSKFPLKKINPNIVTNVGSQYSDVYKKGFIRSQFRLKSVENIRLISRTHQSNESNVNKQITKHNRVRSRISNYVQQLQNIEQFSEHTKNKIDKLFKDKQKDNKKYQYISKMVKIQQEFNPNQIKILQKQKFSTTASYKAQKHIFKREGQVFSKKQKIFKQSEKFHRANNIILPKIQLYSIADKKII